MAQYIDKSALVAEIERKVNICKKVVWDLRTKENKDYYQGKAEVYKETLDLLDTLKVKEVDIEKEMDSYFNTMQVLEHENIFETTFQKIAKHFFELGMSVSNKAEKEVEEEPYVMSDKGKFTTTTK